MADRNLVSEITPREKRANAVRRNESIVDYSAQRHALAVAVSGSISKNVLSPDDALNVIVQEQRDLTLGLLNDVVGRIWNMENLNPQTRAMFDALTKARAEGRNPSELLTTSDIKNPTFDRGNLVPEIVLLTILKDPELSPVLMTELDNIVKKRSDETLKEIDDLAVQGKRKVVPVGVIGGGPLTSLFLSAIGPVTDNLVITDQSRLGEPWRSRLLIYINSAVKGDGGENAPLPILEGGTTPIVARYLQQAIRLGYLLDDTALKILCQDGEVEDGRVNEFISGEKLGNATALNIFAYADNALVGQRVLPSETRIKANGNKIIVIQDVESGRKRDLEISTPVFLTGPGKEYLPLYDERTQRDYARSKIYLDNYISAVRTQIELEQPILLPRLPRVLTLTAVEKLFSLWTVDLKRDPRYYPFASLFGSSTKIGIIGGGDTAKVENEFLGLISPPEAYPPKFIDRGNNILPERDVYRLPTPRKLRVRYRKTIDPLTRRKTQRVSSFAVEDNKVQVTDEAGKVRNYDYVFVGLGFERQGMDQSLSAARIPIGKIRDVEGEVVGLGNDRAGIYLAGSATGFTAPDFPLRIQNIIYVNGIRENTISLWVNAALTERLAYKIAAERGVSTQKTESLLQSSVLNHLSNRMLVELPISAV